MPEDDRTVRLRLAFPAIRPLSTIDLANFLFDLNLLYAAAYHWEDLGESTVWGRRVVTAIPSSSQLKITSIRFESPGDASFVGIATLIVVSLGVILQAGLWLPTRRKTALEIEKLNRDLGRPTGPRSRRPVDRRIEPHFDRPPFRAPIKRLQDSKLQPIDISVGMPEDTEHVEEEE